MLGGNSTNPEPNGIAGPDDVEVRELGTCAVCGVELDVNKDEFADQFCEYHSRDDLQELQEVMNEFHRREDDPLGPEYRLH